MSGFARKLQRVQHTAETGNLASLYLDPDSGSYAVGSTLTVTIYEDSDITAVNAVQANLTYPADKLQYESFDNSSGPFTTSIPGSSGGGTVELAVGSLGGSSIGPQIVATVTFTVIATGTAAITFAAGSMVARASDAADILGGTTGGSYTCTGAPDSATLSLSPTSGSYNTGDSVVIGIYEDSGTAAVNAVQADLVYPSAKLQYVSGNNTGSTFTTTVNISGSGGTAQVVVGKLAGSATGSQLVGTITFTALASGTANITFAGTSEIDRASDASNILTGSTGGTYTIS